MQIPANQHWFATGFIFEGDQYSKETTILSQAMNISTNQEPSEFQPENELPYMSPELEAKICELIDKVIRKLDLTKPKTDWVQVITITVSVIATIGIPGLTFFVGQQLQKESDNRKSTIDVLEKHLSSLAASAGPGDKHQLKQIEILTSLEKALEIAALFPSQSAYSQLYEMLNQSMNKTDDASLKRRKEILETMLELVDTYCDRPGYKSDDKKMIIRRLGDIAYFQNDNAEATRRYKGAFGSNVDLKGILDDETKVSATNYSKLLTNQH
jgi:hypothetical protein